MTRAVWALRVARAARAARRINAKVIVHATRGAQRRFVCARAIYSRLVGRRCPDKILEELKMRRQLIVELVGLVLLARGAFNSQSQVRRLEMKIGDYLCGN